MFLKLGFLWCPIHIGGVGVDHAKFSSCSYNGWNMEISGCEKIGALVAPSTYSLTSKKLLLALTCYHAKCVCSAQHFPCQIVNLKWQLCSWKSKI